MTIELNMKKVIIIILSVIVCSIKMYGMACDIDLTLIPPSKVTNKIKVDVRCGLVNNKEIDKTYFVSIIWKGICSDTILFQRKICIPARCSRLIKVVVYTGNKVGHNNVVLSVSQKDMKYKINKFIEVVKSDIRSTKQISGAWAGIYHWSEIEGKYWNPAIKKMTDSQWKELVMAMHKLEMNTMVIQESFRNEKYIGEDTAGANNYEGRAFYPSKLYSKRMDISSKNPIEAILDEADKLNMNIFIGVGMYAWFDFSSASLEWHKRVAHELWQMYGHHKSFYGFYISEESGGCLDNWETKSEMQIKRKSDIVNFFREFKSYCQTFAPAKPIMLATNSFDIPKGMDTYPVLMKYLDILCPFGFARMPQGDLTGKQAADLLQQTCDNTGSHLWFDLEAFLFNPDKSLYPRPMKDIEHDLNLFDNFEQTLCYQFPGVFNDPKMSVRIGEESTIDLFNEYAEYLQKLKFDMY